MTPQDEMAAEAGLMHVYRLIWARRELAAAKRRLRDAKKQPDEARYHAEKEVARLTESLNTLTKKGGTA